MKHEVQLTPKPQRCLDSYTANVSNGIYAREGESHVIAFVYIHDSHFRLKYTNGGDSLTYINLYELMSNFPTYKFYEAGVNLISLPKPTLTIDDLKNMDHVGFISGNSIKGYISFTYPLYHGVSSNSNEWQSEAYGNFGIGKKI